MAQHRRAAGRLAVTIFPEKAVRVTRRERDGAPCLELLDIEILDLSVLGMRIHCLQRLGAGDRVLVDFELNRDRFRFAARIVWTNEVDRGRYHAGAQFERLDSHTRRRLIVAIGLASQEVQRRAVASDRGLGPPGPTEGGEAGI